MREATSMKFYSLKDLVGFRTMVGVWLQRIRLEILGIYWKGQDWKILDWKALDWKGLDWKGMDQKGKDWKGKDWK